jgi:hypothetical protein
LGVERNDEPKFKRVRNINHAQSQDGGHHIDESIREETQD